jgi:hypothetical protein
MHFKMFVKEKFYSKCTDLLSFEAIASGITNWTISSLDAWNLTFKAALYKCLNYFLTPFCS